MKKIFFTLLFLVTFQSFGMDMTKLLLQKQKVNYTIQNKGLLDNLQLLEPSCLEDYKNKLTNELNSPLPQIVYLTTHGLIPLATGISLGWVTYKLFFGNSNDFAQINRNGNAHLIFKSYAAATAICLAQATLGITNAYEWHKDRSEKLDIVNEIINRLSAARYKNYKLLIKQQEINDHIGKIIAATQWEETQANLLARIDKLEDKKKSRWQRLRNACSKAEGIFCGTCYGLAVYSLFTNRFAQENSLYNTLIYKIITPTILAGSSIYAFYSGFNGIYKNLFYWHRNKAQKLIMANSALAEAQRLSDPQQQAN